MVEAPATPRTPIGLFRAGLTAPDRLEQTTIGREEMLADLLEKLQRSTGKKTHQHYVFIGPRGIGKTHFLSLLVHRIESSPDLCGRFTIVRFAEETHRLLSFADFLLRVCEILSHTSGLPFSSAMEQPTLDGITLAQGARSYAMTPLHSQPGTRYEY